MKRHKIKIYLEYDPPPIPIRTCDWQGWIDGEEERLTASGPSAPSVLHQIAEWIEEDETE